MVAREWETRRQGKRRGKEEGIHASSFLFFIVLFERGQHMLPPFLFISFHFSSNGAALAASVSFLFVSNGDGTRRPQFFSFRTGAALAAPVSFLFVLNGGQRESHMLPPFLLVLIGGSMYPTAAPIPFGFERGQCVSHTPPPVSFGFDRGQHEPHTLPPFCVLYPPIMGILFFYFN